MSLSKASFEGNTITVQLSTMTGSEIVLSKSSLDSITEDDFQMNEIPTISYYLKQRKILVNLLMLCIVWLATCFGFFLIMSLINTFDEVYLTGMTSSIAEMVAYVVSGLVYERIGVKRSFIIALTFSAIGGITIIAWGL